MQRQALSFSESAHRSGGRHPRESGVPAACGWRLALVFLFALLRPALASVMLLCSDGTMCRISQAVVLGRVTALGAAWDSGHRHVKTIVDFEVEEWLKGPDRRPGRITLTHVGGTLDGRTTYQAGAPRFILGEKAVVFLEPDADPPAGLSDAWRVLGLSRGKYSVTKDPATGQETVSLSTDGLTFIDPSTGLPAGPTALPTQPGKLALRDLLGTLRESVARGR